MCSFLIGDLFEFVGTKITLQVAFSHWILKYVRKVKCSLIVLRWPRLMVSLRPLTKMMFLSSLDDYLGLLGEEGD